MSKPSQPSAKTARQAELDGALSQIRKQFGDTALVRLGDGPVAAIPAIPTGNIAADLALGVGGIPKGRIIEIFGPESSGKTTFCLSVIARAQKEGGVAAFIDVEHALDPRYARALGVNVDELLVSQPDCGEDALNIAEMLIRSGQVAIVVIDSVAALVSKKELEGSFGDSTVGLQARLMGTAMRRLTGVLNQTQCTCLFTNQIREKIGVMFGSPETQPGGRALKFFASQRLDIRRIGQIKDSSGRVIGNRTRLKVVKNKVAPPFTECEFDIIFGEGMCHYGTLLDMAVEAKLVEKKGAWYSLDGNLIGQGREAAKQGLKEQPALAEKLAAQIMGTVQPKVGETIHKAKSDYNEEGETVNELTANTAFSDSVIGKPVEVIPL